MYVHGCVAMNGCMVGFGKRGICGVVLPAHAWLNWCAGTSSRSPDRAPLFAPTSCSALQDRRFHPILPREVPSLQCTVSLLHSFEPARSWRDWEIGVHGEAGAGGTACARVLWVHEGDW